MGVVNGAPVGKCLPISGFFIAGEYSPGIKHGSSTNKPLEIDENLVLPNDFAGAEPVIPRPVAFQKCHATCFSCKGLEKSDCTACWAGWSLNISPDYDESADPYPYGYCDVHCEVSKYK